MRMFTVLVNVNSLLDMTHIFQFNYSTVVNAVGREASVSQMHRFNSWPWYFLSTGFQNSFGKTKVEVISL